MSRGGWKAEERADGSEDGDLDAEVRGWALSPGVSSPCVFPPVGPNSHLGFWFSMCHVRSIHLFFSQRGRFIILRSRLQPIDAFVYFPAEQRLLKRNHLRRSAVLPASAVRTTFPLCDLTYQYHISRERFIQFYFLTPQRESLKMSQDTGLWSVRRPREVRHLPLHSFMADPPLKSEPRFLMTDSACRL